MFKIKKDDASEKAIIKSLRNEVSDLRRTLQEQKSKTAEYKDKMIKQEKAFIGAKLEFSCYKINNPEKNSLQKGSEILYRHAKCEIDKRDEVIGELGSLNFKIEEENKKLKRKIKRLENSINERSGTNGGC